MNARTAMARSASISSLQIRAAAHAKPWEAVDVFDLAQRVGVEVRFANIASMEGMYLRQGNTPTILVASERPPGRQRFTCAHELAHHIFGDGSRIDEFLGAMDPTSPRSDEEIRADMFAGLLLMPKTAVQRGFASRQISLSDADAIGVFRVSSWLGVGYTTLLNHLKYALHIIPDHRFDELIRCSPKSIREAVLERAIQGDLIIVDEQWSSRPVDVRVGDFILLPQHTNFEGASCVEPATFKKGTLFKAAAPGMGRFESETGWSAFVRVSRRNYEGRSIFRHLEEVEDE